MFDYLVGKVTNINSFYITLEVNGIGYAINTPNPFSFKEDEVVKIYLYSHIREEEFSLYGFKSEEEREMFLKLISVKGLGPKMALPMLATGSINGLIDALEKENIIYLTKFPKIGSKLSRQIILDLKGRLAKTGEVVHDEDEDLIAALVGLGYKNNEVRKVIKEIDKSLPLDKQIKEALKLMLK